MNGGFPDKYYFCNIHIHAYIYNSMSLPFYTSCFICTYFVFACKSIVLIIIYMYVLFILPYSNWCNHNMFFLSSLRISGLLFTVFKINLASAHCSPTKPSSIGSPCGVPITMTNQITATNTSQLTLHPTSPALSSSWNALPWSH